MPAFETALSRQLKIEVPLVCGAMYPCTNPELVAAVSEAGGIGVVQPLSFVFVYGLDFREGLRKIRARTAKPFGFNALIEKNGRRYEERMRRWLEIALEEGCRFVVSALGNPAWVVKRVHEAGGVLYHDVTERKWALKALDAGVDGFICVNSRAGGHAGTRAPRALYEELQDLGKPLVCAGGVGDEQDYVEMLRLGYAGVQMGTRFIATSECASHEDYKRAIVDAEEKDIVLTERVTGIPLSVIRTAQVEKDGLEVGRLMKFLLRHPRTRHMARMALNLLALFAMKRASLKPVSTRDYFQAGKSVAHIHAIESAGAIVKRFEAASRSLRI